MFKYCDDVTPLQASLLFVKLNYLDEYTRLLVSVGGEGLRLLLGDGAVPLDDGGHDTASGLNSQGEWCDVQKEKILDLLGLVSGKDGSLNGSTVCNSLIGVDGLVEGLKFGKV